MTPDNQHIKVFIAYAREDAKYLDELRKNLRPLERNGTIEIWCDTEINPGKEWDISIQNNLQNAEIILVLVSSNLFDSDYFYDVELPKALERHHNSEAIVIPLILSACTWDLTELKDLQALPEGSKPIKSWQDKAVAYTSIVRGICKNIEQIQEKRIQDEKLAEEKRRLEAEVEKLRSSPIIQEIIDNMISVKGGNFISDADLETYNIDNFHIGKFPVTQEQWREVMGNLPEKLRSKDCDKCPVDAVSWLDTQDFITKLNLITNEKFRLPNVEEWEFAAQGGNHSQDYKYSGSNNIDEVAWYINNSKVKPQPVGQKQPNELDIYDMSGNVLEWCNCIGVSQGLAMRIVKGGNCISSKSNCTISKRDVGIPFFSSNVNGFRLAK